ncbi:hypothetical protein BH24DEI1_BH24DEI1_16380 [soil metagenome]
MKLEHVALNVPDAQAAAAWYQTHLNCRVVKASSASPYIHFLADEAGSMLELYSNPAAPMPDYAVQDPVTLHLAFLAQDIAGERERLLAAGARADGDIDTTPAGDQIAFLRDPWGVTLQLVKRVQPLR